MPESAAQPLLQRHRNQHLFADHYLDAILPTLPAWRDVLAEAEPVRRQIAERWRQYRPSHAEKEAQTEKEWVQPVLDALGHTYEIQPSLAVPGTAQEPDYIFYRDTAARQTNKGKRLTEALLAPAGLAVGDAKVWERPLDVALKGASHLFTNKNPSYQIAFYLQHAGLDWGILTNGRHWRLYHKATAHKLDHYYEVDLPALLEHGSTADFLYFYAFFRRAAFEPGSLGLAALLRASTDYARTVGASLETQVYEALRHLAQGFLDYPANGLQPEPATLATIYDNSLILLYRLLFVLYAEARDLLPLRESPDYRDGYSLAAIKKMVAAAVDGGQRLLTTSAGLWHRLKDLFAIMNEGSPPLRVATFNGGLFDPARHPFLEQHTVGAYHLAQAIDKLARVDGQFVDYRDLAERQLGTIYEGLLEYHLVASPPADGWTVELLNDKGERKASGSYYTPDYIVKYMVEATLGPVLRQAVAGLADDAARVAAVLSVNVLDPAMGSGHFLVEAADAIARFLVDLGVPAEADAHGEADLAYWRRRVAQNCIYGVDLNPLAVELAKLSLWLATAARDRPLSFLDHHLRAGNTLVGARLDELRPGGQTRKKGSRQMKNESVVQLTLIGDESFRQNMSTAVDSMWLIERTAGLTVAEVKEQERLYADLRARLTQRYGVLADLVIATHFGLALDVTNAMLWAALDDYVKHSGSTIHPKEIPGLIEAAAAIAAERRFFHWELEFPEVFFDRHGQPLGEQAGFDAVIGNPPYVRQEELATFKPFFARHFPEVYHGMADLFVYFTAQGLRQLQRGGRLAYISSNSWLRANYATPLRAYLRSQTTVETLIDLGDNRVFADAPDVYPAIHVIRREPPPADHAAQAAVFRRGEGVARFEERLSEKLFPVSMSDQADTGWQLGADAGRAVFAKLMAGGRPLGEVVSGQMYRGVLTGLNEAFIINQATRDRLVQADPASATIIKPILRGEDLRPWYQENEGRWLIVLPSGWTAKRFGEGLSEEEAWHKLREQHPSIAAHLFPFAEAARQRQDKGEYWWELRPCDYYPAFDKPKILWPELAKQPRFSKDASGVFVNNKGYIAPVEDMWLLGLLNSRVMWFVIMRVCLGLGERAGMERFQLFAQYISRLPTPDAPEAEREAIGALAMAITEQRAPATTCTAGRGAGFWPTWARRGAV